MKKMKTKKISMLVAVVMLITAFAQVVNFGGLFQSNEGIMGRVNASVADPTFNGMPDPSFKIHGGQAKDSIKLNEDGTIRMEITPTLGYGFRANATNLGDSSLLDVKKFTTTFTLEDVPAEVSTVFSLQTIPTGTIAKGAGNGINIIFRKNAEGKVVVSFLDNDEKPLWTILGSGVPAAADGKISIEFDYDSAYFIKVKLATEYTIPGSLQTKFKDFFENTYAENDFKAYYSVSSYYFAAPENTDIVYTIESINSKTPLALYKEALNAQITAFIDAVGEVEKDTSDKTKIDAALALNTFGEDEGFGKLLAQFGSSKQKADITAARATMAALNVESDFDSFQTQINKYIAKLDVYDDKKADTQDAAVEAYKEIDWSLYDKIKPNAYYKGKADSLIAEMKGNASFKASIYDLADKAVTDMENATSAEFVSSSGYISVKEKHDGWEGFKTNNFFESLEKSKADSLDARVAVVKTNIESSFYNNFYYFGTESIIQKYDEGLYVSVKPDRYPETNNGVSFKEKMTLDKDSEIAFNLIYAFRGEGLQMQIAFYPVSDTMTKRGVDGVRVDFWRSNVGITEIKLVNGKDETDAGDYAILPIQDEDFFDFEAEELDYKQSHYIVKLHKNADGSLYVTVNGLRIDVAVPALNADLYKDGVYITMTNVAVPGVANSEYLVTKIGATKYADIYKDETPDTSTKPKDGGCSGCKSSLINIPGIIIVTMSVSLIFILQKRKRKMDKN